MAGEGVMTSVSAPSSSVVYISRKYNILWFYNSPNWISLLQAYFFLVEFQAFLFNPNYLNKERADLSYRRQPCLGKSYRVSPVTIPSFSILPVARMSEYC